jgi:hypothetical protein
VWICKPNSGRCHQPTKSLDKSSLRRPLNRHSYRILICFLQRLRFKIGTEPKICAFLDTSGRGCYHQR